ncbi:hypothetical protein Cgig2_012768 [Carnegiea gigantea]|uniref:PB1 domain-containing protein n=1 Tax=Carnegiea gigantea TaxID=171969 RepID=A0A9Q1KBR9_9CARY|nr:hypothetical protein Cgig2_012768 [Carnegiea gigantea]
MKRTKKKTNWLLTWRLVKSVLGSINTAAISVCSNYLTPSKSKPLQHYLSSISLSRSLEQRPTMVASSSKTLNNVKFLCSYGGRILPRRSDGCLRYVGGVTRVVSVPESTSFSDLMVKLGELCGYSVRLRCQLPSEDLDVLVSIKSDEDLSNVIEEYRKASSIAGKELKIRAILSPPTSSPSPSPPYTSSSSSSGADLRTNRFRQPAMAAIRRFPEKKAQFNAVPYRRNYNYYACRQQVSSHHKPVSSSYFPQHAYYWH